MTHDLLGFDLDGPDNGSHMYQGAARPPACAACGLLWKGTWTDPAFQLGIKYFDFSSTYDHALIVSERFKRFAEQFPGAQFHDLASVDGFYMMTATPVVRFDSVETGTRFEDLCEHCGRHQQVAGATPGFVLDPIPTGFSRTDVEFGSYNELSPGILVDPATAIKLTAQRFHGLELHAVRGEPESPSE